MTSGASSVATIASLLLYDYGLHLRKDRVDRLGFHLLRSADSGILLPRCCHIGSTVAEDDEL